MVPEWHESKIAWRAHGMSDMQERRRENVNKCVPSIVFHSVENRPSILVVPKVTLIRCCLCLRRGREEIAHHR